MGRIANWLRLMLSVNPKWRDSLMPPTYRPPADAQGPDYDPQDEIRLRPQDYLYHGNRDDRLHNPETLIITVNDQVDQESPLIPFKMTLYKDNDAMRNKGEYYNVSLYK